MNLNVSYLHLNLKFSNHQIHITILTGVGNQGKLVETVIFCNLVTHAFDQHYY